MMNLADIFALSKTRTIESTLVPGLWLSRCAVAIGSNPDTATPVLGFSSDFDFSISQDKAFFELIEYLAFHPAKPLLSPNTKVWQRSDWRWHHAYKVSPHDLLLGAFCFFETLHGNGCAVHRNLRESAKHAESEVLERHFCCEMWYKRTIRPRPLDHDISINRNFESCVGFYELDTPTADHLIIAVVKAEPVDFFCIGASMKPTREAALRHSLGEAAMLFEDAVCRRTGRASTASATANILSLRDRRLSQQRERYFSSLLALECGPLSPIPAPTIHAFRILEGMVATRASTAGLLTPRRYHNNADNVPILPLF
jgi:hypothetical protein